MTKIWCVLGEDDWPLDVLHTHCHRGSTHPRKASMSSLLNNFKYLTVPVLLLQRWAVRNKFRKFADLIFF
jgi:hypothetical protein